MVLRSALAGPGPSTLAFRLGRCSELLTNRSLALATNVEVQNPSRRLGLASYTTTALLSEDKKKKTFRAKKQIPSNVPSAKPVIPVFATPSPGDILDYVPRLAAPVSYRQFAMHLEGLRQGLEEKNLDQVIEAYSYLSDWFSVDQLTLADWELISELLSSEMSLPLAPVVIARMNCSQPERMGWLSTLAVEAAVRDHWSGLYQFFLSLITAGHPQLVVNAYGRYRDRLHVYQGKNKDDLHSWNRTTRMAARTTGDGIKPISTVHLAALVMLDKIDPTHLTAIFGSRTNWMWVDFSTRRDIIQAFGKGPAAKALSKRFDEGIDKFLFAILCHHPATMADRLVGLRNSNSREQFYILYQRILDWSVGPDRILRPLDLDTKGGLENVKDIVIPPEMWLTIIQCLTRFSRPDEIDRLIEHELPARGLTPSPVILAQTCIAFALIGNDKNTAEATRKLSQQYGQELWTKYIEGRPLQHDDHIVAAALHTRYMYEDRSAVLEVYRRLAASRTNIGPLTRSALIHILFSLDQVQKAVEVLGWTMGNPAIAQPSSSLPYATFVRTYLRRPPRSLTWIEMARVLESRPKDVQLSTVTRALMVTAALAWSAASSEPKLLDTLLSIIGKGQNKYTTWRVVLGALLTHNSGRHSTTDKEARMGLGLLRAYIAQTSHIQTQSRSERLWQVYLRQIAHSLVINSEARQKYLLEAVSIFEDRYGRIRRHTMFTLVDAHLSRRHRLAAKLSRGKGAKPSTRNQPRSEDAEVEQALYWWKRMRGVDPALGPEADRLESPISDAWYTRFMYALVNASRVDAASQLVADAWNQEQVPLWAAFWDEARDAGILAKAGIGEEDLEGERQKLLDNGKMRKKNYVREQNDEETLDEKEEQLMEEEEMERGQGGVREES